MRIKILKRVFLFQTERFCGKMNSAVGTSTLAKLQNSRKWLNSRFFRVKTPKKIVVSMLYGVALYDIMVLYEVIVHETQL